MEKLKFVGPFAFVGAHPTIDAIGSGVNGVYLWCIKGRDEIYRVHYVGEAVNVAKRLKEHLNNQMAGKYTGFCPDALRENIKVLKHRANQGMVTKYSNLDPKEFNRYLLELSSVFYADLGAAADKQLRCRYEFAVHSAIEDSGQNILAVGHLRSSAEERFEVTIDCGASNIQALNNAVLLV